MLAGVTSAALFYFGTGLNPVWWMAWLAPVPIFAAAPRLGRLAAFTLAVGVWFIGQFNMWSYFTRVVELPVLLTLVLFLEPALVFALGVLFVRSFLRRGLLFSAAVAFPVYWVSFQYLSEVGSPHSTFGNLAYTQMNCLPLIQISSLTGIWGISFAILLFAATTAALLSGIGTRRERTILFATVGLVLCAVFLFGMARLRSKPAGEAVAITLVGKDVPISVYISTDENVGLGLLREYADEIEQATPVGTQIVVLPEKLVRINESALPEVDAMFSAAASATHAAIDLGLVRRTPSGSYNSARFYSAAGQFEANYDKHHLIPKIEPEKPGDKRVVLSEPSGQWGLQICKDLDFPALSREYAADGANLLLVPAWDFNVDRWLHARMAMLRAVENGFALARAARNGVLTLSDNRGRVITEAATLPGRFVTASGEINVTRERTFYSRTGDWFAWLCLVAFLILLSLSFVRRGMLWSRDGRALDTAPG
jgi:apolipoprotein N-acyltransferase